MDRKVGNSGSSKVSKSDQNIQVFVRVRPTNSLELKSRQIVEVKSEKEVSVQDNKQHNAVKTFTFNNVFGPQSSQIEVYRAVVHPLIDEVLRGYNCTVFAYGQTGTGKTFTMEGERSPDTTVSWENDPLAGIVPRTLSQIFDELRIREVDFCVKVSFLELYNEELFDLLSPADDTTRLRIFEDSSKKGAVIIEGLEEVIVHSKVDVYKILERGSLKRQTAATLMNAHSSRSHTVFSVTVHIKEAIDGEEFMRTGKMNLVDLAGSENIGRSGAIDKRAREAGNINQSLLTLGRVITALVDHSPHVPYRESKLTRILQESLGGRTKTSIIATVSPASCNLEETLSTLEYAHRAKNIQNKPEVNQRVCKKTMLKEYSEEIERLQRDLEATRQRTGVFLAQGEYDQMIAMLHHLEGDINGKMQEKSALECEMKKMKASFDELSSEVQAIEEIVQEKTEERDQKKMELLKLKSETKQIMTDAAEKDYLLMCHMETFQNLTVQAGTLRQSSVNCTSNAELLYDKVDRTRNASQQNRLSIQAFISEHNTIMNDTENLLHGKIAAFCDAVACAADCKQKISSQIQASSHEAIAIAGRLKTVSKLTVPFQSKTKVTIEKYDKIGRDLSSFEEKLLDTTLDELYADWVKGRKENLEAYTHILEERFQCAELDVCHENALEVSRAIFKESSETFRKDALSIADLSETSAGYVCGMENEQRTAYQRYSELQKELYEKCDAMKKLLMEMDRISQESVAVFASQLKSDSSNTSKINSVMAETKNVLRNGFETQKQLIDQAQVQVVEKLELIPEHLRKRLEEIPLHMSYSRMDDVDGHCQMFKDSAIEIQRKFEECVHEDTKCCSQYTLDTNAFTEEVKDIVIDTNHRMEKCMIDQELVVENLTCSLGDNMKQLHIISEDLTTAVSKNSDTYERAVMNVVSLGAKPATPTGKTPIRADLRIPRDLVATSPHDRILTRLRSRYNAKYQMSLEDPDTSYSDADTDLNSSGIQRMDDKENCIEQNLEKNFQSKLPVTRRPLSSNN